MHTIWSVSVSCFRSKLLSTMESLGVHHSILLPCPDLIQTERHNTWAHTLTHTHTHDWNENKNGKNSSNQYIAHESQHNQTTLRIWCYAIEHANWFVLFSLEIPFDRTITCYCQLSTKSTFAKSYQMAICLMDFTTLLHGFSAGCVKNQVLFEIRQSGDQFNTRPNTLSLLFVFFAAGSILLITFEFFLFILLFTTSHQLH